MRGLVIGKFYPPHRGHQYLIDFATAFCDATDVVVCSLPTESIPGETRVEWMRSTFGNTNVFHLDKVLPQLPHEAPDFWQQWTDALDHVLPERPDAVFTSEGYGERLAQQLDAEWITVDGGRDLFPISGTEIRHDPAANWDAIVPAARSFFVKKIVVFGPESTGKSTLAARLAEQFQTSFVPEYARHYLERRAGAVAPSDMETIARAQDASIDAMLHHARRYLICDTDARATRVWSDALFGETAPAVAQIADATNADLYLLCDVDVPWVEDVVRYLPNERASFLERCRAELRDQRVVVLSGDWETRFTTACDAIATVA